MRLFQASDALALTGLTRNQLREWTGRGRREIIFPDVDADGPGRHALFSWQTLLVLRLLLVLHRDFASEVGAWGAAARELRQQLEHASFAALWSSSVFFSSCQTAALVDEESHQSGPGVFIPLAGHLQVLADKLSLPRPAQLPLFPPMLVSR